MAHDWVAFAAALPWILAVVVAAWRWRGSPSLDDIAPDASSAPPRLSVIVPARDEAGHIGDCVRAILRSTYPALELIVVDDHSTDGTGDLARAAADGDRRLTLTRPPPLPPGWLGKQWACAHGSAVATGDLLLFTDADVRHGPDLHARAVRAMEREKADLLSVAGHQEAVGFWERVVQPFVFSTLAQFYGGAGAVNRSRRVRAKIANGQFLLFRRQVYDAAGGHGSVRNRAAEDLAFAQQLFSGGYRTYLVLGLGQMSTRMYSTLGEIVAGWGKNLYAAGRETLPFGRLSPAIAALLVPVPALVSLAPPLALGAVLLGAAGRPAAIFGATAALAQLVWFGAIARRFGIPLWYALLFPLGAAVYLYIALGAVTRGARITWKGRSYRVGGVS